MLQELQRERERVNSLDAHCSKIYNPNMNYEWDEHKRKANLQKHGVDFREIEKFDWVSALVLEDQRKDYGESRYRAMGRIGSRLHALVFTLRDKNLRVISLRKANRREVNNYEEKR